jgi:signal transduction histidine kinase
LANITAVLIGFWVYSSDPKGRINKLFSLLIISILLYIDFAFLANISNDSSLIFIRLELGATAIFFIVAYKFFLLFPKISEKTPIPEKIWNIIWFILLIVSIFTPLIVKDVKLIEWGNGNLIFGDAALIYYAITSFSTILLVYGILYKKYLISSKEDKVKIQYYVFGMIFAAVFNLIFNIILPIVYGSTKYHEIGDYSWIPFVILVAVSIVKRNLFGIRIVLVYTLVSAISVLLLLDILVFQNDSFARVLKIFTLLGFLYFGRSLIKSVTKEIELREQLQNLNLHLQEKVDEQTVEIRKAYEVEKKARVELQELDKSKSEFILTAQHHLRTPLTIIKGFTRSILDNTSLETPFSKVKDNLSKVDAASDRLMSLVNEFLDISQMEVGKSILKLEKTNIKPLIEDIIAELKPDIEKNHITVTYPQEEVSYPQISIDPKKLKEALMIFVDNATKYNSKENGRITIITKTTNHPIERDKKLYQITIENTGIGIKPEELPKLFTHYFERGEEARKLYATGRGLGLNIAKSIINAHNGTVRVESEGEGKGARFIVELPLF